MNQKAIVNRNFNNYFRKNSYETNNHFINGNIKITHIRFYGLVQQYEVDIEIGGQYHRYDKWVDLKDAKISTKKLNERIRIYCHSDIHRIVSWIRPNPRIKIKKITYV